RSAFHLIGASTAKYSCTLPTSGHQEAVWSVPPYLPMESTGLVTTGASGRRLSTLGNLPALTISASAGASLYWEAATVGSGAAVASPPATMAPVVAAGAAAPAVAAGAGVAAGCWAAGPQLLSASTITTAIANQWYVLIMASVPP